MISISHNDYIVDRGSVSGIARAKKNIFVVAKLELEGPNIFGRKRLTILQQFNRF